MLNIISYQSTLGFRMQMALQDPLLTYLLWFNVKKWTLEPLESHLGGSVLNHSFNNTVFCLHGLCKVSKSRVSGGLPVIGLSKIQSFNSKIVITLFLNDRRDEFSICLFFSQTFSYKIDLEYHGALPLKLVSLELNHSAISCVIFPGT